MTEFSPRYISLNDLLNNALNNTFCLGSNKVLSRADLLAHAIALSKKLPAKSYAINLCQDRYLFIVAYLAVCLRQKISLLPANQTAKTLADLTINYPDSYILSDDPLNADCYMAYDLLEKSNEPCPLIDTDRPLSISFTSGSTGKPKAIIKTWREFQKSAELALERFELQNQEITLLSTAPMQHMYGLETSFFWVLFSQMTLHNSRPFYPEDIRKTLADLPAEKILISTPRHLKICCQTQDHWSAIKFILSSTAPMDSRQAQQIEQKLQTPLYELLGSTETLSFASRQASKSNKWQPYTTIQLTQENDHFVLQGGHIIKPLRLDDTFEIHDKDSFSLLGRSADLIKIAGKRASLHELNQQLTSISGIEDGVFFFAKNERLSALVVSKLAKKIIIKHLRQAIDEVFLPRAIYSVFTLPRNNMGKLLKTELEQLIQTQQMLATKQHYRIPAAHPCFAGHFPNNPIVPGVVLLNYVQQQLLAAFPNHRISTLTQAKFLQPLLPDQDFSVSLTQSSTHNIKFTCMRDTETLVTGTFIIVTKEEKSHD
ncbi:MAG: AMP-binding protein [Methyloprofundus sp.]|nr:AMP-binding protein [Methyloprofundus sp.]MDT8426832.1 AMP-binding protein [Methyloprofundus sp.]